MTTTTNNNNEGSTMTTTKATDNGSWERWQKRFAAGIADAIMDAIYETCRSNDVPVDEMQAIGREALRQASERNG